LIADATVSLDNLKADMSTGAVQVLGETRFAGKLSQPAVQQMLQGRAIQGWKKLKVAFKENRLALSGVASLGSTKRFGQPRPLLGVPVTVVGQAVPRGTTIDFKADSVAVETLQVPQALVKELERRVNPVLDLTALKVLSQITRVAVDGDYLVTEARLDFSKGLAPKKKRPPVGTAASP
jgi:hypothetical protein